MKIINDCSMFFLLGLLTRFVLARMEQILTFLVVFSAHPLFCYEIFVFDILPSLSNSPDGQRMSG